jgi:hypothetical protein
MRMLRLASRNAPVQAQAPADHLFKQLAKIVSTWQRAA